LVSHAHALVAYLPGSETRLALVDLGSDTGTWVDERQIHTHILEAGAEFTLGQAFRFRVQPAR
jgi:pSer/pThr/pTyr-binding forkhead associated (FHA) protein